MLETPSVSAVYRFVLNWLLYMLISQHVNAALTSFENICLLAFDLFSHPFLKYMGICFCLVGVFLYALLFFTTSPLSLYEVYEILIIKIMKTECTCSLQPSRVQVAGVLPRMHNNLGGPRQHTDVLRNLAVSAQKTHRRGDHPGS